MPARKSALSDIVGDGWMADLMSCERWEMLLRKKVDEEFAMF